MDFAMFGLLVVGIVCLLFPDKVRNLVLSCLDRLADQLEKVKKRDSGDL